MSIYFNPATEKYPIAKLNIPWDALMLPDRISFSECIYTATADCISLFGVLDENCLGIIKAKDKDWKPAGELTALFLYAKQKEVWDVTAGKYVTQQVHSHEAYLFSRLSEALAIVANDAKFSFSSNPLPNPTIQTLVDKNQPEVYMTLMEELLIPHLVIGAATTDLLTAEKTKPFFDTVNKSNGAGTGSGGFKNYKPAETEEQKLQARLDFVLSQMRPAYEARTICQLCYELVAGDDKPGSRALDVLLRIVGK